MSSQTSTKQDLKLNCQTNTGFKVNIYLFFSKNIHKYWKEDQNRYKTSNYYIQSWDILASTVKRVVLLLPSCLHRNILQYWIIDHTGTMWYRTMSNFLSSFDLALLNSIWCILYFILWLIWFYMLIYLDWWQPNLASRILQIIYFCYAQCCKTR